MYDFYFYLGVFSKLCTLVFKQPFLWQNKSWKKRGDETTTTTKTKTTTTTTRAEEGRASRGWVVEIPVRTAEDVVMAPDAAAPLGREPRTR